MSQNDVFCVNSKYLPLSDLQVSTGFLAEALGGGITLLKWTFSHIDCKKWGLRQLYYLVLQPFKIIFFFFALLYFFCTDNFC